MSGLRITHVSTSDAVGGAAKCAQRLHAALLSGGWRSRMLVALRSSESVCVREYNPLAPAPAPLGRTWFRVARRFHRPPPPEVGGAFFSFDRTLTGWRLLSQLPPSDVVNLHWTADFLDYRTLPRLAGRFPVVWTFHDMNAFTGGCHYCGPCERYLEACGACPLLGSLAGPDDSTRQSFERKRLIFGRIDRARLTVVAPSRWLAGEAQRSPLLRGFPVRVIPSGVDTEVYRPAGRAEARGRFGLPADARIVLFVAESIGDRRKGLGLLLEAIAAIRDVPRLLVVTIGGGRDSAVMPAPLFRHLGPLHDEDALRTAYAAADVFAIPSLQDNFPNTVLESMACGTPVAGFDSGGVGEQVSEGRTGLLAPAGDGPALARVLRRVLEDEPLRRSLGCESRARAELEFGLGLYARRYAAAYEDAARSAPSRETAALRPGGAVAA